MLLQTATLSKIATKNLITVTAAQSQLETNFELILKALTAHDSLLAGLQEKYNTLDSKMGGLSKEQSKMEESNINQNKKVNEGMQKIEKDINEINKKLDNQALVNPETSNEKENEELRLALKLLQDKVGKVQGKVQLIQKQTAKIERLQEDLKNEGNRINNIEEILKNLKDKMQKMDQMNQHGDNKLSSEEDLKKLIDQVQKKLSGDLNKAKQEIASTTNHLEKQLKDLKETVLPSILKLKDAQDDMVKNHKKLSEDVWKLNEDLYKHQAQDHGNDSSLLKRLEQLENKLNEHLKGHSAFKNTRALSTNRKTEIAQWTPKPEHKQKQDEMNTSEGDKDKDDASEFKKEIIEKLKQQKGDFNKALKKLDTITLKKQDDKFRMGALEDKILKLQLLIEGKMDEDGLKKWMKYIQNKINYLYRIVNVQSSQQDACIARKHWNCLSCDKNLDAYRGKIGTHLISSALKGRPLDNEILGGGMLFKSKSRYELPNFKKEK